MSFPNVMPFGQLPDGRQVERITLRGGGVTLCLLTHGARVQDLRLAGVDHPLVIGSDTIAPYLNEMMYHGAIVGRCANRIAQARFDLDGGTFYTDPNEWGLQTLHGGADGTSSQIWQIAAVSHDRASLICELPDGHMGFPGAMSITVTYSVLSGDTVTIDISAKTDRATLCNFTHHGYFFLDGKKTITDHALWIDADYYLPVDNTLIPTQEGPAPVQDTRFDFRVPRVIGTAGLDHNFCLNNSNGKLRPVASLTAPGGLTMEVQTDQPGLQVYDAGQQSIVVGLGGRKHGAFAGIAMETQIWPDAANRPDFPSATLFPHQTYRHCVSYSFQKGALQ